MLLANEKQFPRKCQVRNQEFFRAGEFSWNQGTLINIQLQHKKEKSRSKKITDLFAWKLLKIAF